MNPKSCERFVEELAPGGAPSPEFAAHLATCPSCRADLGTLEGLRQLPSAYAAGPLKALEEKVLRNAIPNGPVSPAPSPGPAAHLLPLVLSLGLIIGAAFTGMILPRLTGNGNKAVQTAPALPVLEVSSGAVRLATGAATLLLPQGTSIDIRGDSCGALQPDGFEFFWGQARFQVPPQKTFRLVTSHGILEAQGAAFRLETNPWEVRLWTETGSVAFTPRNGSSTRTVHSGESSSWSTPAAHPASGTGTSALASAPSGLLSPVDSE